MQRFYEWDEGKAESNYAKHGIRFELAAQVFDDPFCIMTQDRVVDGEERWKVIGAGMNKNRLMLVACTFTEDQDGNEIVCIISARRATRTERGLYEHR